MKWNHPNAFWDHAMTTATTCAAPSSTPPLTLDDLTAAVAKAKELPPLLAVTTETEEMLNRAILSARKMNRPALLVSASYSDEQFEQIAKAFGAAVGRPAMHCSQSDTLPTGGIFVMELNYPVIYWANVSL